MSAFSSDWTILPTAIRCHRIADDVVEADERNGMAAFIFLCDLATEQECLDRKLFGTNPGEMHQHHYRKIALGDTLFLYNFETGILRGPFIATTTCTMNLEPQAWKKLRRNFPWQVRVDDTMTFKTPISADELRQHVSLSTTKIGLLPPAELNDEQAAKLLEAMKQKNQPAK